MAPLAMRIADAGFRTIAFDVTGHGESKAREASWGSFIRDISDVAGAVGPLAGFVGHSAGGLAMMAARRLGGMTAGQFACICVPHHPYPPVREIEQRLNPGDTVLEGVPGFPGCGVPE